MLRFKDGLTGCRVQGVQPELILGLLVVNEIFSKNQLDCTITCISDSKHSNGSLHYVGFAADIGLPPAHLTNVMLEAIKLNLGQDFDVVIEKDHIHIEFQPKRGVNLNA